MAALNHSPLVRNQSIPSSNSSKSFCTTNQPISPNSLSLNPSTSSNGNIFDNHSYSCITPENSIDLKADGDNVFKTEIPRDSNVNISNDNYGNDANKNI